MKKLLLVLFTLFSATVYAQDKKDLNVSMRLVSPFVFEQNGKLTGFSVELWENLAQRMGRKYTPVPRGTLAETFQDVKSGKADLAIAAISITAERESQFDFSLPMFDSGMQIMVSSDNASNALTPLKSIMNLLKSKNFLYLLGGLVFLILLPLPFIYYSERNNPALANKSKLGKVGEILFWSISTFGAQSTQLPSSPLGRVVSTIAMYVALIFISFFTASFAAGLTVQSLESSISDPRHLPGKKVATVKNSTSAKYLRSIGVTEVIEFDNIKEAYPKLLTNEINAVVYDSPILLYHAANEGKGQVAVVGSIFKPEAYGILFQEGNPLRKEVNAELLKMREAGDYERLYEKWFGKKEEE